MRVAKTAKSLAFLLQRITIKDDDAFENSGRFFALFFVEEEERTLSREGDVIKTERVDHKNASSRNKENGCDDVGEKSAT